VFHDYFDASVLAVNDLAASDSVTAGGSVIVNQFCIDQAVYNALQGSRKPVLIVEIPYIGGQNNELGPFRVPYPTVLATRLDPGPPHRIHAAEHRPLAPAFALFCGNRPMNPVTVQGIAQMTGHPSHQATLADCDFAHRPIAWINWRPMNSV